jgi:molecular chaperone GrpE
LEQARQEIAEHFDRLLRLQAEFENYKRRMHKERSETLKYAQLPLLRDLTGVVDDLERAIAHARGPSDSDRQALVEGLKLVTKQMGDVFERYGMTRIAAKGQPFDPRLHEAMKVVETDEFPENTVIEEFRTGYALHERIVRPSMVSVSKKPHAAPGEQTPAEGALE